MRRLRRAKIVAIQKPPGKQEKIEIIKSHATSYQVGKIGDFGLIGPGQANRMRGFLFTIGPISGNDNGLNTSHEASSGSD